MKKPITIAVLAFIMLAGTFNALRAQSTTGKFQLGIKVGATLNTFGSYTHLNDTYKFNNHIGFQGGIYAEVPIYGLFYLMPQVLYTQNGGNLNDTGGLNTYELKTKINYLNVPILIAFKPSSKLTLSAGPQINFLLSQSSVSYLNSVQSGSNNSTKNFKKTLLGANFGIGYNFARNIGINVNYMFDFKQLGNVYYSTPMKNRGFALTLNYAF